MEEIKSLRVVYSKLPPFVDVIESKTGPDILGGFMPAIFESIMKWMNVNSTWAREPEDKYGTWENNTWTGMVGMLFRNEVDAIVNPLLPNADFTDIAYYSNPVIYEAFTFLSGKEKEEGDLFLYFSVLQPLVWTNIGASLLAITVATTLLFQRLSRNHSWIFSLGQYFWVYTTYMLHQVPNEKWLMRSKKNTIAVLIPTLIIFWTIGITFLVMNIFQSLLVSKLAIVKSHPIVDSMSDMVNKKNVKGLTVTEIELQVVLKDSGLPLYEKLWTKLEPELVRGDVLSDKFLHEAEKGKVAIIHGHLIIENALSNFFRKYGQCNFHLSDKYFYPFPLLVGLRKSLPPPFLKKFNEGLTRMIDGDISGKWFKPVLKTSHLCTSFRENDLKPLKVKHILGVLVIWCFGIFLSILCLIVEIGCKRRIINFQ